MVRYPLKKINGARPYRDLMDLKIVLHSDILSTMPPPLMHFESETGAKLETAEQLTEAVRGPGGFGGVTYRGHTLFDIYCDETDDGGGKMFGPKYDRSGQECYLGYDPDEDVFLSGWDKGGPDNCCVFRITDDGEIVKIAFRCYGWLVEADEEGEEPNCARWYASGYRAVHAMHKRLIDIRLD